MTNLQIKYPDLLPGENYFTEISIPIKINGRDHVTVTCICGNKKLLLYKNIRSGNTKSCGCYAILVRRAMNRTHGKTELPLYWIWAGMKARCYNKNNHKYKSYGARGIDICSSWLDNFQVFYDWCIANGWQIGLQIDRIDNNKGYSPLNCRFVTNKQNGRNKRDTFYLNINGETKPLIEWAEIYNINPSTIRYRIKKGWDKNLLFKPVKAHIQVEDGKDYKLITDKMIQDGIDLM